MAGVAQAVCVTATWDGVRPNGGIDVTVTYPLYNSTGQYTGQVSEGTVAGIYTFKSATWYDGAALDAAGNATGQQITDPAYPSYMYAFCIDLRQNIAPPDVNSWYLAPDIHAPIPGPWGQPMTPAQATRLEQLFGNYYQGAFDGTGSGPGNLNRNATIEAAAFQVAVWETVWEQAGNPPEVNALSDSRGNVYVNSGWSAADRADYMLNNLDPTKHLALAALVDPDHQDQIILLPGGSFQHAPEPLTLVGLLMGVGGLMHYARKRRTA
jgi:hypothetical protein